MARRYYQLKIWPRGTVSTTGAASYTLGSSYFKDAPVVGGQIVRAAECQVESNPWRVTLLDIGSTFTAKIADSSGRLHLLGRLCQLQSALDSTASFSPIGTGRLTDLALNPDIASYDLDISDERWIERQTDIFTKSNTMAIVPHGPISRFQQVPAIQNVRWRCVNTLGNLVCLRYDGAPRIPTDQELADLIVQDVKPTAISGNTSLTTGNFQTLRVRNTGNSTDYEIAAFGFGVIHPTTGRPTYPANNLFGFWNDPVLLLGSDHTNAWTKLYIWLVWSASQPSIGSDVTGYFYAPTHPPTSVLPYLIGGSSGLHPGRFTRNAYSGMYSATTSITVRSSTAKFDQWEAEPAYGRFWYQATEPANLADFLDERIYGPYNVAPVVDSSGKIAPTRMWTPTSTQLNVAGLASITSTNAWTVPTWEHPSREAVTAVRYTQELYGGFSPFLQKATTVGSTFTHDTLTLLGRRQLVFRLGGVVHWPHMYLGSTTVPVHLPFNTPPALKKFAESLFARFGDGPVYSQVEVSSSIDATTNGAILPGMFVKMNLATFPNALTLARNGTRTMQVLKRDITPRGRGFLLLDAASTLANLAAPTITIARSTQSTRHAVVLTAASVTAGARWEAHIARTSTGTTAKPAANSSRWVPAAVQTTASLTALVGSQPSKTKIWARVRQFKNNRIGSGWSTASPSTVTASIAAPTTFSVTSLTAGGGLAKWTNGSSLYGIELMIDASSVATLTSTNMVALLPPQTTRYTLQGLTPNDTQKGGVRHFDPYGGRSAQATNTFLTTTGSGTAAPSLRGMVIVEGTA